jgi:DNA repair photolyase
MDWFMGQLAQGYFEVVNPFNNTVSTVSALPESVHTIVFWSKNFGPFIKNDYIEKLQDKGYNLFFNFTINSEDPRLEPQVLPLKDRLKQLETLCQQVAPMSVQWRFDPICFYRVDRGHLQDNLSDFDGIAHVAAAAGVRRCITSFMDHYPKIKKRLPRAGGLIFVDPPMEKKLEVLCQMEEQLETRHIGLFACCEKQVLEMLPGFSSVGGSSCIPNDLLMELYGGKIPLKRDFGQRTQRGCGCRASRDIGSYRFHPCFHNCLFCYANPSGDRAEK